MLSPSDSTTEIFSPNDWLNETQFAEMTNLRINEPELSYKLAQKRVRRKTLTDDGYLNVLAVDHPARFVTQAGDEALAMADRQGYLARMIALLSNNCIDGVMATMDILEELLLIQHIKGETFLDNKLMMASLNRGGLAGSAWELDDPMTGASVLSAKSWQLDGIKVLWRMDLHQADSLTTMKAVASVVTEANQCQMPVFVEPLPVATHNGNVTVVKKPDQLAKLVGVATALGDSSRYMWLKLPYCEGFETVANSTTCPILFLGGDVQEDPENFYRMVEDGLNSGGNVRGMMVGRNVMFPANNNPVKVAERVQQIVHRAENVVTPKHKNKKNLVGV